MKGLKAQGRSRERERETEIDPMYSDISKDTRNTNSWSCVLKRSYIYIKFVLINK